MALMLIDFMLIISCPLLSCWPCPLPASALLLAKTLQPNGLHSPHETFSELVWYAHRNWEGNGSSDFLSMFIDSEFGQAITHSGTRPSVPL